MSRAPDRSFTLQGYQSLVRHFLEDGFEIRHFLDCDPAARHLVLRHDIDMSLDYAERMARAESDIGITSTYFVLLRHGLYNLWSGDNIAALNRIRDGGHKIGLHFDASLYDATPEALQDAVAVECDILESILRDKVEIVSFHRPAENLVGHNEMLAGRAHTYMPKYTEDMHYYADSRGEWRFGNPVDASLGKSLQLLTHPIWWVFEDGITSLEKLAIYLGTLAEQDRITLGRNCRLYQAHLNDLATVK